VARITIEVEGNGSFCWFDDGTEGCRHAVAGMNTSVSCALFRQPLEWHNGTHRLLRCTECMAAERVVPTPNWEELRANLEANDQVFGAFSSWVGDPKNKDAIEGIKGPGDGPTWHERIVGEDKV
jgi:hypothetical protein